MTAHYETDHATLYLGDCLDVMRELADASVHSVVTDPPYGIEFMGREWDRPQAMIGSLAVGDEKRGAFAYGGTHNRGFADHDAHAFQTWCRAWATEAFRVLKPGGHLLSFGAARSSHRLTAGIEDAGFEIRDSIAWLYGQGFPKSLDVAKAIDKGHASGRERALEFTAWMRSTGITAGRIREATGTDMATHYLTDKSQPEVAVADKFDLLRPYLPEVPEEIEELVRIRTGEQFPDWQAREVTGQHGKSAPGQIWAENYRDTAAIPPKERRDDPSSADAAAWRGWGTALKPGFEPIVVARKPLIGTVAANVLAHGTGAIHIAGTRTAHASLADLAESEAKNAHASFGSGPRDNAVFGADLRARAETGDYDGSAGRWPTNVVLTHSPLVVDGEIAGDACADRCVPGCPVAELGGAARFFGAFRYEPKAPPRERPRDGDVAHPTVKPVDLMRWLVRLVTVEGGTVLEPFAGSGTTVEACLTEGMHVIAIERDPAYIPLIEARMRRPMNGGLFSEFDL